MLGLDLPRHHAGVNQSGARACACTGLLPVTPTMPAATRSIEQNDKSKRISVMMNTTLEQLRGFKHNGMAADLHEQLTQADMTAMSF